MMPLADLPLDELVLHLAVEHQADDSVQKSDSALSPSFRICGQRYGLDIYP